MLIKSKKINEGGLISDMADIALYLETLILLRPTVIIEIHY